MEVNADKSTRVEIQNLRTELNLYKKCLNRISYDIEHLKKGAYDYGKASESLLSDIKDEIIDTNNKINLIRKQTNGKKEN
jgi:phage-related minor tail protein